MSQWAGPFDDPDRYELHQLHSRGGEGELWRGSIGIDGVAITVAIKVLHHRTETDVEEEGRRLQRQAELLRTLDHPNLVKVREMFVGSPIHDGGAADASLRSLYLVMNWVDGDSGDTWVATRPDRDVLESIRVVSRLADGVDYLHSGRATSVPVLHRDIKPGNVVINGPDVRLVDFGLARLLVSQPLTLAGTPAYLAPEVVAGEPFTEASDRFSVGATAYYLLTGNRPDLNDPNGMLEALREVDGSGGRSDLAEHVLAMMNPDPTRRPDSCTAWARGLTAAAVSGSDATIIREESAPPRPSPVLPPPGPRSASSGPAMPPQRTQPVSPTDATTVPTSTAAGDGGGRRRRWPRRLAVVAGLALLGGGTTLAVLALGSGAGDEEEPFEAAAGEASETDTEPAVGQDAEPAAVAEMPDVVGESLDDARSQLAELDIAPVTVEERESGEPSGTVLAQKPAPDAGADDGAVLTVAVTPSAMPEVVGLTLRQAEADLLNLGIEPVVTEDLDPDEAEGTILSQSPEGGGAYQRTVDLEVSTRGVVHHLADLEPVEGRNWSTGTHTVNGESYTRSVAWRLQLSSTESYLAGYDLGRRYERFVATVGLDDGSPSGGEVRFEVFGDGHELHRATLGLGETEELDVEVSDVLRLQIHVTRLSSSASNLYGVFADPRVIGFSDRVPDLDD